MEGTILLVAEHPDEEGLLRRALQHAQIANPLHIVNSRDDAAAYLVGDGRYADRDRYPFPMLIIIDLSPPRRNGQAVLRWVRQQPSLRWLPIVAMASPDDPDELRLAYDLGTNAYLMKPLAATDLSEILRTANLYRLLLHVPPTTQG